MYQCPVCSEAIAPRLRWLKSADFSCSSCGARLCMSPTPTALWTFRVIVLTGVVAIIALARSEQRPYMLATMSGLFLAIYFVQAFGEVVIRSPEQPPLDRVSSAMNGPHGLKLRLALLVCTMLFVLYGMVANAHKVAAHHTVTAANVA